MLTPEVVKAKEFQASGRGAYRAEDVDSFLRKCPLLMNRCSKKTAS